MTERLYRSPTDRVIAGVAGGLAEWMHVDPSLVRIAWVVLAIMSGGLLVLVYFVMMIVVPLPPPGWVPGSARPGGSGAPGSPAPGAVPGWQAPEGTGGAWQEGETATGWGATDPEQAPPQTGWSTPPQAAWSPPPAVAKGASNAGVVVGAVLVLLGLWFFIQRYVSVDWDLVWPVVVIGLGVVLIAGAMRRRA